MPDGYALYNPYLKKTCISFKVGKMPKAFYWIKTLSLYQKLLWGIL